MLVIAWSLVLPVTSPYEAWKALMQALQMHGEVTNLSVAFQIPLNLRNKCLQRADSSLLCPVPQTTRLLPFF